MVISIEKPRHVAQRCAGELNSSYSCLPNNVACLLLIMAHQKSHKHALEEPIIAKQQRYDVIQLRGEAHYIIGKMAIAPDPSIVAQVRAIQPRWDPLHSPDWDAQEYGAPALAVIHRHGNTVACGLIGSSISCSRRLSASVRSTQQHVHFFSEHVPRSTSTDQLF